MMGIETQIPRQCIYIECGFILMARLPLDIGRELVSFDTIRLTFGLKICKFQSAVARRPIRRRLLSTEFCLQILHVYEEVSINTGEMPRDNGDDA